MTETLSQPEAESQQQEIDNSPEGITARFNEAVAVIEDIKKTNEHTIEGRSSLADVTGNLESTVGPDLRYYKEDGDPEDLEEAQKGLEAMEAYLGALGNTDILVGELTEAGADPELRQKADVEAAERHESAVRIYAHILAEKARRLKEANDAQ
jgi:hypothetical protein